MINIVPSDDDGRSAHRQHRSFPSFPRKRESRFSAETPAFAGVTGEERQTRYNKAAGAISIIISGG